MKKDNQPAQFPNISEDAVHTILEIISDGIWDWDANTGYVYRNPGWYTMLGYEPHSLENDVFTWENVIHPDDFERVMEHFDAYITKKSDSYQIEYRCRTKSGDYIWVEDRGKVIAWNPDGTVARMIGAHKNIHDSKSLYEELQSKNKSLEKLVDERTRELLAVNAELEEQVTENIKLAETDALTSAANRYRLEKALKQECERAKRFKQPLSVIATDIDNFKLINDEYGHATGDLTLIHIVKLIKSNIREIDLVSRWGGDEFMILLPNTPLTDAWHVADKLRQLIASTPINGLTQVTMSFGVAELGKDEEPGQLTVRADRALYQSKSAGKNVVNA